MKRIVGYLLLTVLLLSLVPTAAAEQTPYIGIDVSHHQQTIDWDAVAPQIDFAVIRCGYGGDKASQDDRQWVNNVTACERLGIPYGVYLYSYATTEEEALSEADHALRLLKGHKPSLPVYYDVEDPNTVAKLSPAQVLNNTRIFCNKLVENGYQAGVYSSYSWWVNKLTSPEYDNWDRWIARWNVSSPGYSKPYSMWQYTDSGRVDGISGAVDMNYWYGDLPTVCAHAYTFTVEKAAGCTTGGVLRYTCSLCGDSYTVETEPAGHAFDGGVVTLPPTSGEAGIRTYTCARCGEQRTEEIPPTPLPAFADVPEDDYYSEAVNWAVENEITRGTSETTFSPDQPCTRGQIVTFLWRANGCPLPETRENPFTDVRESDYWYHAVLWAVEQGITKGTSETTFSPDSPCTRGHAVTFLYRLHGAPGLSMGHPFEDVVPGAYYEKAVIWAVFFEITQGTSETTFSPDEICTRGQIVTFLYRDRDF